MLEKKRFLDHVVAELRQDPKDEAERQAMYGSLPVCQEVSTSAVLEGLIAGKHEVAWKGSRFGGAGLASQVVVVLDELVEVRLDPVNVVRVHIRVAPFSHVKPVQDIVHEAD
jgi:hypothetical protein